MEKDLNIGYLKDIYGTLLTDNQREMLSGYYDCDLSLGEIAQNCGISRQAVRDCIKKGKDALILYEDKLGFKAKTDKLKSDLKQCLGCDDLRAIKEIISKMIDGI